MFDFNEITDIQSDFKLKYENCDIELNEKIKENNLLNKKIEEQDETINNLEANQHENNLLIKKLNNEVDF
jgi:hypothetical protein